MHKKAWLLLLVFLTAMLIQPAKSWAEPKLRAEAAVLIDGYTGEILWEKNAHKFRHPASTVKILTALITLNLENLDQKVVIGKKAHQTYVGQTIGLKEGDVMTVRDLMGAALLWSANDAAVALAEHVTGDPKLFSLFMNKKAWALGAFQSSFRNPNGYSVPGQYSTAYDLALMARAAMEQPFFAETVKKNSVEIKWLNREKSKTVSNTNGLLDFYAGANGVKTGTTNAAGGCLVASAVRNGKWYIATVLGSSRRYDDAAGLLNYGFEKFDQIVVRPGEIFDRIKVINGEPDYVEVVPKTGLYCSFLKDAAGDWQVKNNIVQTVKAPVRKGQVLGTVEVYFQGQLKEKSELAANNGVKRARIFNFRNK
ncbi:D-alanyl-D-alanine carboxypeptidase family protein [Candidatus Formimonas warabiya]|uniref:serine-type D-Ala-D-Ala carboxypeptidase n=1 Tax=Formimonas warabiya TaxID=1761012 RepID=A0A3G1L210_FORW1|nr:D-alanyl-D-alanine carboxypeptidase family protein [Candidatus Formimonas warabiya]ATW28691.1 hypothetical protein DCMF_17075 [Candidatus Formimonas warabiya]